MFAAFPLLALPVLVYNLIALTLNGGFSAIDASAHMTDRLFNIRMTSNVDWPVSLGDLLLAESLSFLKDTLLGESSQDFGIKLVLCLLNARMEGFRRVSGEERHFGLGNDLACINS